MRSYLPQIRHDIKRGGYFACVHPDGFGTDDPGAGPVHDVPTAREALKARIRSMLQRDTDTVKWRGGAYLKGDADYVCDKIVPGERG